MKDLARKLSRKRAPKAVEADKKESRSQPAARRVKAIPQFFKKIFGFSANAGTQDKEIRDSANENYVEASNTQSNFLAMPEYDGRPQTSHSQRSAKLLNYGTSNVRLSIHDPQTHGPYLAGLRASIRDSQIAFEDYAPDGTNRLSVNSPDSFEVPRTYSWYLDRPRPLQRLSAINLVPEDAISLASGTTHSISTSNSSSRTGSRNVSRQASSTKSFSSDKISVSNRSDETMSRASFTTSLLPVLDEVSDELRHRGSGALEAAEQAYRTDRPKEIDIVQPTDNEDADVRSLLPPIRGVSPFPSFSQNYQYTRSLEDVLEEAQKLIAETRREPVSPGPIQIAVPVVRPNHLSVHLRIPIQSASPQTVSQRTIPDLNNTSWLDVSDSPTEASLELPEAGDPAQTGAECSSTRASSEVLPSASNAAPAAPTVAHRDSWATLVWEHGHRWRDGASMPAPESCRYRAYSPGGWI